MTSTITENTAESQKPTFPALYENKTSGAIVLFTGPTTGVLLRWADASHYRYIGTVNDGYQDVTKQSNWKLFDGTLSLKN